MCEREQEYLFFVLLAGVTNMDQEYFTARQVASLTGYCYVTVIRWAEAGRWGTKPGTGRDWRFHKDDITRVMGGGK
jgi:hypothetical protein